MSFYLRYSETLRGALTFIGNTAGLSKSNNKNEAGVVDSIGAFISVRESDQVPTFPARTTLDWRENGSAAQLNLPIGATVVYAELVWGGNWLAQNGVTGERVDLSADLNVPVHFHTPAGDQFVSGDPLTSQVRQTRYNIGSGMDFEVGFYMRSLDVTSHVQNGGNGEYAVHGVPGLVVPTDWTSSSTNHAGWTLAVVYSHPTFAYRRVNLWAGAEFIELSSNPIVDFDVDGFVTPSQGTLNARVLVSAQEGDATIGGDQLLFGENRQTLFALSGPNNPVDNFFCSQINNDAGLLDVTGTFGDRNQDAHNRMNTVAGRQGWDVTNVDASHAMEHDQSNAVVRLTTSVTPGNSGEAYMPNMLGLQLDIAFPTMDVYQYTSASTVMLEDDVDYTFLVTNSGSLATNDGIEFRAAVPSGTTLDFASLQVTGVTTFDNLSTPSEVHIRLSALAIGQTGKICYTVSTSTSTPGPIVSEAIVDFSFTPVNTVTPIQEQKRSNVSTVYTVLVGQRKQISSHEVIVGDTVTYTITIDNRTSTAPILSVYVYDPLYPSVVYVPFSTVIGTSPAVNVSPSDGQGIFVGTVAAGALLTVSFSIRFISLPSQNPLPDTTQLRYSINALTASNNNLSEAIVVLNPALRATKSTNRALARVGQSLVYSFNLLNDGDTPIENIVFTDLPPDGTEWRTGVIIVNGTPVTGVNLNAPIDFQSNPALSAYLPLAPSNSLSLSFLLDIDYIPVAGRIQNEAVVIFQFRVQGHARTSETTTNTVFTTLYALSNEKRASRQWIIPGESFDYSFVLRSTFRGNLPSVIVFRDVLPPHVSYDASSLTVTGAEIVIDRSTANEVELELGRLIPSAGIRIAFRVVTSDAVHGVLSNRSSTLVDGDVVWSSVVETTVHEPRLTKQASVNMSTVGSVWTYVVDVSNQNSAQALQNFVLYDPLGDGVNYVPNTTVIDGGPPIDANPAAGITLGEIQPNETVSVRFQVQAVSMPTVNPYVNRANGNFTLEGVAQHIVSNEATVRIVPPTLSIVKQASKLYAKRDERIRYTFTITNTGADLAENVALADTMSDELAYVTGTLLAS
ncbi:MAG: hypothetical protein ACRC5C_05900, partial [Bacilli bacterium]